MTDSELRERLFSLFKQTDDLLLAVGAEGHADTGSPTRQRLLESVADHLYQARNRVTGAVAEVHMFNMKETSK